VGGRRWVCEGGGKGLDRGGRSGVRSGSCWRWEVEVGGSGTKN
jgi:hypothetical protein